jgi:hypothetical protein
LSRSSPLAPRFSPNACWRACPRPAAAAADAGKSALWAPPPHPDWRPPQPQPPPWGTGGAFRFVDVAATPPAALYPLVISAVVPRPIAFISTLSGAGGACIF